MTDAPPIRPLQPEDARWALALNARYVEMLSPLDAERLERLRARAFRAWAVGDPGAPGAAFLLSFDETADYDSPNFLWLRARLARFVYVDRVVVSADAQRGGHASRLYARLFEAAEEAGRRTVACEVNLDPPNPKSDAFHADLGFTEIGRAGIGAKTVRYLARAL
jgi:predicted GNAT superfamily acetyltransferase